MGTCRLCLLKNKFLHSIHDLYKDITYSSMLNYVANIKVAKGINDGICSLCCRKLRDSYFFKLLIIRSDQVFNVKSKIIKFDSITDVVPILFKNIIKDPPNCTQIKYSHLFKYNNDPTLYNNTVIKRLKVNKEPNMDGDVFMKNENETNEGNNDVYKHNFIDEEVYGKRKTNKMFFKKSDEINEEMVSKNVCIKPKLLEGYRVIPCRKIKDHKDKKSAVKREDICPYCGKKTRSMKSHILVHAGERKFKCNGCKRGFYSKHTLKQHIKSHSDNFTVKCDKCIAAFNTEGDLKRHMLIHTDVMGYICNICDKSFKRKRGLQRHTLIHYTGAKTFLCDVCDMSFFNKYSLKTHSRVHTGERPFKCELCSQPYSYKRDFNRHCYKKHGVILHRRPIHIMNEEVLKQERALMKDLTLYIKGVPTENEPLKAFCGPQAALAFDKAAKVMKQYHLPEENENKESDNN